MFVIFVYKKYAKINLFEERLIINNKQMTFSFSLLFFYLVHFQNNWNFLKPPTCPTKQKQ